MDASLTPPPVKVATLAPGEPLVTVDGVPLEPGERVLAYVAANHRHAKWIHIVLGIVLVPILFGVVLIVYGALYDRWHLKFAAITDRRVIVKIGEGPARWLALDEIVGVRARRESGGGGGGVLAAASAVNRAAESARAANEDRTSAAYWVNTEAVIVQAAKGSLTIGGGMNAAPFGLAIAKLAADRSLVASMPTVNHPA